MNNEFKSGDKALCINPSSGVGKLKGGKVYDVIDIVSDTIGIIDETGEYETHGIRRFFNFTNIFNWWNMLPFEDRFYKVIAWLSYNNRDTTERHPDNLTPLEIKDVWDHD